MGIKSFLAKPYASFLVKTMRKLHENPAEAQKEIFHNLIQQASQTQFGKDHQFVEITSHQEFVKKVPIRDYEQLRPYIDQIVEGKPDVLWPGKPAYFCKTSGTTSGAKYIPLSKESVPDHIHAAKMAMLCYIDETGKSQYLDGKMMFLQGSPEMSDKNGIPVGRLSGITAHWVPNYLQKNRLPSWETNCIDDWETKVDAVVDETTPADMRLISGIPSWVQMYFEKVLEKTGKATIAEVFPNFSLFIYGGLNYEPYRPIFKKLMGKDIPAVETFPASEGFIAYQDSQKKPGLLLNLEAGIFYEFVPVDEIHNENPTRLTVSEVEVGVNYALILNTNSGLWGYNIGDTVKFVSTNPHRLIVSGRIKHFISAFGEHVIAEEVESTMKEVMDLFHVQVREFHLAPQVNPAEGELPYHEWFVEFEQKPANMDAMRMRMDLLMQEKNPYYKDLIQGNILQPLRVTSIERDGFQKMMKSRGKLGGQNKIPRLANDCTLADLLADYKL